MFAPLGHVTGPVCIIAKLSVLFSIQTQGKLLNISASLMFSNVHMKWAAHDGCFKINFIYFSV